MQDDAFRATWQALQGAERRRVRRLARIGRLEPGSDDERLAAAMARHQGRRIWWRGFWLWFVPGLLVALAVAYTIHPIVIGVVLASAAQALVTRRNLNKLIASA